MKELRAHVVGMMPKVRVVSALDAGADRAAATRPIRLLGRDFVAAVRSRASLRDAETLAGPAIVNQMDTTILIPPGWQARPVRSGALVLERVA